MKQILLMEDDVDQSELLAAILIREGFDVTRCSDANEAMDQISVRRFDLVISDLFVRQSDVLVANGGLRLIGFVRNGKRSGEQGTDFHAPIIAVSGVLGGPTDGHFLKIAGDLGANLQLQKPLDPMFLVEQVNRLIAERG